MYLVIAVSQLRMRRMLLKQKVELTFRMWLFPWLTYLVIVFIIGCLVTMAFVPDYQVLVFSTGAAAIVVALMGAVLHVRAAKKALS
uniref:Amino acid permease/ SLC12A domain-containing protein n=1 Tax=Pseudomonas fluorescens TaxID=294 RepID=A0A5E6TE48_PSEFL|nr:hypothetical protein PS652_02687 [Pseudomonas fluorescens]